MIRYSLHQIFLEGLERYYLLLPKLNDLQVKLLVRRLEGAGFRVKTRRGAGATTTTTIRANLGERAVTIEKSGLAWSNMDLVDPLAPVIPALLAVEQKERVRENPYFIAKRSGGKQVIRLFVRMEALGVWEELRKGDLSGLAPDEAAIISSLLEGSSGEVRGVTDYPRENGRVVQFGSRVYYESMIDAKEFVANLRTIEGKNRRNSYLPRNSVVEVQTSKAISARRTAEMIGSLGEWCYLIL